MMKINLLTTFIEKTWEDSVLPALKEYVSIPAVSPGFDKNWTAAGFLMDALVLAENWCRHMALERTKIQIISKGQRTPVLLIEIDSTTPEHTDTTFLYGHLDKQPPARGWDSNKGPWQPVIENNRLYGRGSADDGYAVFTAITAIKALQVNHIPHGRCVILIETCEESGSVDLEFYLEHLEQQIGIPDLIVCLDSGCGDYDHMWVTTSLRGAVVGELEIKILTQGIHSGRSGMVASSFRILRQVLDRIEDATTGELLVKELYGPIPEQRLEQIKKTAQILGTTLAASIPLVAGARPMSDNPVDLIINSTWKPMLSCTGAQGFPPLDNAGNVIRAYSKLLLSIRTPPTVDAGVAAERLKTILEKNPPYGARVTFTRLKHARGWDMPEMGAALEKKVITAARACFDAAPCYAGEGGSIPFMTLLADKFPHAKFLITGVLGPGSNAHGPNEFLHIPYVKKLTCAISCILDKSPDKGK